jgi:hypothetical protein
MGLMILRVNILFDVGGAIVTHLLVRLAVLRVLELDIVLEGSVEVM